jgi:hypothetical protein
MHMASNSEYLQELNASVKLRVEAGSERNHKFIQAGCEGRFRMGVKVVQQIISFRVFISEIRFAPRALREREIQV